MNGFVFGQSAWSPISALHGILRNFAQQMEAVGASLRQPKGGWQSNAAVAARPTGIGLRGRLLYPAEPPAFGGSLSLLGGPQGWLWSGVAVLWEAVQHFLAPR